MIDLLAMFQEAENLHGVPSDAGFPVSGKPQPECQVFDSNKFSGISGISGSETTDHAEPKKNISRRAQAGGRASAREGYIEEPPEIPEIPEKLNLAEGCLSGSLLRKPEKEKETGTAVAPSVGHEGAFWCSALVALSPDRAPCPGYRGEEWPRVLARALDFLDTFGPQAEALGWTASRLFGVHPEAGIVRVDACGALTLPVGGPVRAITATEVSFGHLTHRTKPGQPAGVPWWEFGR